MLGMKFAELLFQFDKTRISFPSGIDLPIMDELIYEYGREI
jgi:hypothetical protein